MSMWWEITGGLFKPFVDVFSSQLLSQIPNDFCSQGFLLATGRWRAVAVQETTPQTCQLEPSLHSLRTAQSAEEQRQKLGGTWDG